MGVVESVRTWFSNKDVFNGTLAGILSAILIALPLYAARVTRSIIRWTKVGILWRLLAINVGWLAVAWAIPNSFHTSWALMGLALAAGATTIFAFRPFAKLGLIDAHAKARNGIDFATSLKMARSSIDFLGIGADKLTVLPEFEAAMMRCATAGNRVRLLLSPNDNPALERAARRNDTDASEYKRRVQESVRRIAVLVKTKKFNIEIRRYQAQRDRDLQQFRLMFIDGWICLAGWTVLGAHIGKDNPQLVLRNHPREHPDATAYKAFHDYFESLWEDPTTERVDLSKVR